MEIQSTKIMSKVNNKNPWFSAPSPLSEGAHIAIIGGGISGLAAASFLCNAGYKITIIEEGKAIMNGASGNPVAIIDPYISLGNSTEQNFYKNAFLYAIAFYKNLGEDTFEQCGIIKIPKNEADYERFVKLNELYPDEMMYLENGQLNIPKSGYVRTDKIAKKLSDSIDIITDTKVTHLKHNSNETWTLCNHNQHILSTDAIITCSSFDATTYAQTTHISLTTKSGQISYLKPSEKQTSVLCGNGYITPPVSTPNGFAHVCGATFDDCQDSEVTHDAHTENLNKSPLPFTRNHVIGGRRSIRSMSADHLPVMGPVAVHKNLLKDYEDVKHGPQHKIFPNAKYHPNLFINVGLGARGFLSAPYLGCLLHEIISGINNQQNQLLKDALHPSRFTIRDLSKTRS